MSDELEAKIVRAVYTFKGKNNDELCFKKGDLITITQVEDGGWWEGTLHGLTGWFPSNYVKEVQDPKAKVSTVKVDTTNRDMVILNIVETEGKYLEELTHLVDKYLQPIECACPSIPAADYQTICNNIIEISDLHGELFTELSNLKGLSQSQKRPAGSLMMRAPQLKSLYEIYSTNHAASIQKIDLYSSPIIKFLGNQEETTPMEKQLSIANLIKLLSAPFRRLEHYPKLLKELEPHTELSLPDRGDTQRAIIVYNDIETLCRERRRTKELEHEVLTSNIKYLDGKPLNQMAELLLLSEVQLVQLIHQQQSTATSGSGAGTVNHTGSGSSSRPTSPAVAEVISVETSPRIICLFPNVMVLLSPSHDQLQLQTGPGAPSTSSANTAGFIFQGRIHLSGSSVRKLDDTEHYTNAFEISGAMIDKMILSCKRSADQKLWVNLLKKQSSIPSNLVPLSHSHRPGGHQTLPNGSIGGPPGTPPINTSSSFSATPQSSSMMTPGAGSSFSSATTAPGATTTPGPAGSPYPPSFVSSGATVAAVNNLPGGQYHQSPQLASSTSIGPSQQTLNVPVPGSRPKLRSPSALLAAALPKRTWSRSCIQPLRPLRPPIAHIDDDVTLVGSGPGGPLSPTGSQSASTNNPSAAGGTGASLSVSASGNKRESKKVNVLRKKPDEMRDGSEDALLLTVIDAYCTSAKTRHTVNSALINQPQLLIPSEEMVIMEEVKEDGEVIVEHRTLVDAVYYLEEQVKSLRLGQNQMKSDLEAERHSRQKLEKLLKKSIKNITTATTTAANLSNGLDKSNT